MRWIARLGTVIPVVCIMQSAAARSNDLVVAPDTNHSFYTATHVLVEYNVDKTTRSIYVENDNFVLGDVFVPDGTHLYIRNSGVIDGRSFLSEAQLAKQFGVSKAPVRDALHLLCSQGYLISYPRKGYMLNLYSSDEINQIQVIRRQVEKLCVKLAIENASNEEILSLKEFTEQQMGSSDPSKTNNTMFHLRLAEITGNQYLPGILQDMLYKASMAAIKSSSDLEKHQHIVNALLERDLEKAEQYLEEDILML